MLMRRTKYIISDNTVILKYCQLSPKLHFACWTKMKSRMKKQTNENKNKEYKRDMIVSNK